MYRQYWKLLRPHQWTKNLVCFAGVIFGGQLHSLIAIRSAFAVCLMFIAASSAMYIFNDIQDVERDRQHPRKRFRPIASGQISIGVACAMATFLILVSLWVGYSLNVATVICLSIYIILNLAYSVKLKHIVIVDVTCIALGFVLRLMAGVYAIDDTPTGWITLCTFFLSLFLGFCKRRSELYEFENNFQKQRPVLQFYTISYLDALVNNTGIMAIISYALFTTTTDKNPSLVITIPLVNYGIMKYHHLLVACKLTESPDRVLLKNLEIQLALVLWLILYIALTYADLNIL
ncbi:decaprenyl-phosphate phosphoribosyltransferase [Spirulina subsalsa FACHB-351]|uniref:Decaprenyl-phosphate phosphoribosyltransferase n=1 Tax=Spirulina subsalsa FACHB-351 TaxID=234711 RepID=A0ABT3L604_9CYAN|nr:decaprenyl-phosphate phosphoribosyltransferase [Spirulina subsalsa]MCW6036941.1 decaprenyl-phosphate phosphoribosyltransferase [Spirulina subsalsa FACHB-351]